MAYSIIDCFMISAVCGFLFGAVYEVLRILRRVFRAEIVTVICDVLFFAAAAVVVLQLSLFLGNFIRSYTLLGFGCGVFTYIQTLGRLISAVEMLVLLALRNTVGAFFLMVGGFLGKTVGAFAHMCGRQFGRIHDFFIKTGKKAFSLLHSDSKKMYNTKRDIISHGESSRGKNVIKAKIRRSS